MDNLDIYGQPYGGGEAWPKIRQAIENYARNLGQKIIQGGQEREALMNQAFDPNNPLKVVDERALAKLTDMIMSGELGFAPAGITAFHGSPYLFKQFDPMKVGTGEGAQAYGVGAGYTSEARGIAEKYSPRDPAYEDHLQKLYKQAERKQDYNSMDVLESAMMHKRPAELRSQYGDDAEPIIKKIEQFMPKSYLYKGDIPDEILPKFLNWDRPLKEQSEDIQKVAKELLPKLKSVNPDINLDNMTGEGLYRSYQAYRGNQPEFASEGLEAMGIRGIRYTDVNNNDLVSNFIPFSPKDFKIQEINDIPLQEWYAKGLLEQPMDKVDMARKLAEENSGNEALFKEYMRLRRLRDQGLLEE